MARLQVIQSDYAGKVSDLNVPQLLLSFIPQNPFADLAYARADYLLKLATRITALNVVALQGNPEHFDERLFAAKPQPGQILRGRPGVRGGAVQPAT